jgi:hypothetical protein
MAKKALFICMAVALAVCIMALFSVKSHAGVTGSKHDLSMVTGTTAFTFQTVQVCVFCHTPHGANEAVRSRTVIAAGSDAYTNTTGSYGTTGNPLLLWNRALANVNDAVGTGEYLVYGSSTLNAEVDEVRAYSLVCLSCHDGVGSMGVMANPPNMVDPYEVFDANGYPVLESGVNDQFGDLDFAPGEPNPNIGERDTSSDDAQVDISNDHPVSFDYDDAYNGEGGASGGLEAINGDGVTVGSDNLRLFPNLEASIKFVSVECPTCHDVHNQGGVEGDAYYPFLAASIKGSVLCINCHIK